MICHEPRTNENQEENKKKDARDYSTQQARGGAGQDWRSASLGYGLPQIRLFDVTVSTSVVTVCYLWAMLFLAGGQCNAHLLSLRHISASQRPT